MLWADVERTAAGLRSGSAHDADKYAGFDRLVRSLGRFLGELAARTPPDIESPGLGDAIAGLQLGRSFRGLGQRDGRTITRVLPMAVADFVAEWFESDALQAAIAWRGVQYTAMGPWSAGTTAVAARRLGRQRRRRGRPDRLRPRRAGCAQRGARGGGAGRRRGDPDGRRRGHDHLARRPGDGRRAGRWRGDRGAVVVAGIDPKQVLTRLADPVAIGPSLLWRAGNIRTPGAVAKVNLVLSRLPRFTAARSMTRLVRGRILIAPGIDALERAHDAAKFGRPSDAAGAWRRRSRRLPTRRWWRVPRPAPT